MTFPTKPGFALFDPTFEGPLPGIRQEPQPVTGENFLDVVQEMRDLLKENNSRNFNRVQQTDFAGASNYAIGRALDFSNALTDELVECHPTHKLTILDWPFELQAFGIRLHDRNNPLINILRSGTVIESDTPIKRFFVTSSPGLSGFVEFITGGVSVREPRWSLLNPLSFEQRRKHVRIENQANFDPPEEIGAIDQPGLFFLQDRLTVAATTIFFTGLQANSRLRCYGNANSEIVAAAGDLTQFQIQLATDPGSANRNIIHRHQFTTEESVTKWDVEYFFDTVETQIEVFVIDPGPAGNGINVNMHLEVHPL